MPCMTLFHKEIPMNKTTKEAIKEQEEILRTAPVRLEILTAFLEGKDIQRFDTEQQQWIECLFPIWNWITDKYRIAPEETLIPFNQFDFPKGVVWVKRINPIEMQDRQTMVIELDCNRVNVLVKYVTYKELADNYIMSTDGCMSWRPAGIKQWTE